VSHAANESQPVFSPDGKTLAFVSDRTGGGDIYLLTLANGDLRRLTFDDGNEQLDGWSRDGSGSTTRRARARSPATTSIACAPPAACRWP
jgi:Tol biopolymer transport system component